MSLPRFLRRRRLSWKNLTFLAVGACIVYIYSRSDDNDAVVSDDMIKFRRERFERYKNSEGSRVGPGEKGMGVHLTGAEKEKADSLFEKEAFNIIASDKISLERSVKDIRDSGCSALVYPKDLPKASVIVIFHNEAWTPLLRTAHSVVNRSPPEYLHEVILLDDFSDRVGLGQELTDYVAKTWPDGVVSVVRTKERSGLIRARLAGARAATGDVLIFLDSHCEAAPGWIEPILARIKEDRRNVLCPIIDVISDQTLEYSGNGGYQPGGFSWSLHFTWEDIPESSKTGRKYTDPLRSPTMIGGLLAVDRKYFFEIGAYDEGMDVWGGENLEISFRVIKIPMGSTPCDLLKFGWMNTSGCSTCIEETYQERLKCKSFKWYLDNVIPDKFIPDENVQAYGMVFSLSKKGELRREDSCCSSGGGNGDKIALTRCFDDSKQRFTHSRDTGVIKHEASGRCLDIADEQSGGFVHLRDCNGGDSQKWEIEHYLTL
ncbi:GALT9-like protein [Mya arenaria]|uniref:Polypeptide N-acetylgalactosaminyltransferase n=1 Tax=Mya arenaria TaxID=6604 RepID=A0ABY7DAJ7_MYAAR|nr:GALT9-like protein [Mya arenaria]